MLELPLATRARVFVLIAIGDPILRALGIFIATLGGQVEEMIGGVKHVNSARVGRIGVVYDSFHIPVERADALKLVDFHLKFAVIVTQNSALDLRRSERVKTPGYSQMFLRNITKPQSDQTHGWDNRRHTHSNFL